MSMFSAKFRVNRDKVFPEIFWSVERKLWFWPFWHEYRAPMYRETAEELTSILNGRPKVREKPKLRLVK